MPKFRKWKEEVEDGLSPSHTSPTGEDPQEEEKAKAQASTPPKRKRGQYPRLGIKRGPYKRKGW